MIIFDDETKQLFLDKLQNLITNGETINHHKSLESTTTIKNAEGEVIRTSHILKTEKNVTLLPTPAYVMQMVDKHLSLEESIKICQQSGYIVIDPTAVNETVDDENQSKGLSEHAVHEIRAKLLGIEA